MQRQPVRKIHFVTPIKALHRLKAAGFTEKQAEAQVEFVSEFVEENLATRQDLLVTKQELQAEIKEVRSEIKELGSQLRFEIKDLELRLTVKTAAIVGSIVGFFSVLEKILK